MFNLKDSFFVVVLFKSKIAWNKVIILREGIAETYRFIKFYSMYSGIIEKNISHSFKVLHLLVLQIKKKE